MRHIHSLLPIDWTQLEHGETLRKFVAKDESDSLPHVDFSVEIHGLIDESGNFYITDQITTKRKEIE